MAGKTLCFLVLVSLVVSCADTSNQGGNSGEITAEHQRDALGRSLELNCADDEDCPKGVAVLVRVKSEEKSARPLVNEAMPTEACTAFMIDDLHALTSAACLSDDLALYDSARCRKEITLAFSGGEKRVCQELSYVSQAPIDGVPEASEAVAVIKLNQGISSRNAWEKNESGLLANAAATLWHAEKNSDPENPNSYTLTSSTCQSQQNSMELASYSDAKSPFLLLTSCGNDVQQSFRGAPITSADHELVAIVTNESLGSGVFANSSLCMDFTAPTELWMDSSSDCPSAISLDEMEVHRERVLEAIEASNNP